jgi:hypothetical protein
VSCKATIYTEQADRQTDRHAHLEPQSQSLPGSPVRLEDGKISAQLLDWNVRPLAASTISQTIFKSTYARVPSLFWDVTRCWLVVTGVSEQPIGPIFKGRAAAGVVFRTPLLPRATQHPISCKPSAYVPPSMSATKFHTHTNQQAKSEFCIFFFLNFLTAGISKSVSSIILLEFDAPLRRQFIYDSSQTMFLIWTGGGLLWMR